MVNKKKEGLSRLFEIAGQKKSLLLLAGGVYAHTLLGDLPDTL